jgi:hypothetical protein
LRSVFNLLTTPIVRLPIVNPGDTGNQLPSVFSLLEAWIGARADAEQLFFSEIRSKVARMPLLNAGLELAEVISKQQSDLAHLLVGFVERAVVPPGRGDMHRARPAYAGEPAIGAYDRGEAHDRRSAQAGEAAVAARGPAEARGARPAYAGERATENYTHTADLRSDFAQRGEVLRLTIQQGTLGVAVPLRLRNHRESVDTVSLSAVPPRQPGVTTIPPHLIRFDPQTLVIPALSESSVQLLFRLGPGFEQPGEYWSEIVIDGAETKRVPLALQIRPDAQPGT